MERILYVCALISLQFSACLLQEYTPTVAEYFLEAMDVLGRDNWRYFLPNDTDIDQDGSVSELEIEKKLHMYLGLLFKMMDQDDNNIITEQEMKSLNLEIDGLTNKVIDIAMGSFPLKPILLARDVNNDGFYDEDDFYLSAQLAWERPKTNESEFFLEEDLPVYDTQSGYGPQAVLLADLGASVLCKSLGFEGLDEMVAPDGLYNSEQTRQRLKCQGGESRLEDCEMIRMNKSMLAKLVRCRGEQKLGPLHLVGGKDGSAGDIIFGNKGLGCLPLGPRSGQFSEMICRQLGFPGFLKTTRGSAFTKNMWPEYGVLKTGLSCTGSEQNVVDCKQSNADQICDNEGIIGIVCKTDTRIGIDDSILADMAKSVGWNLDFSDMWEKFGRFLFIADINHDGKLTEDELTETAKKYMSGILEFLDQNQDGHISIHDINTINLQVGPIHKVLDLAFDVFANRTIDDINLHFPTIAGINPTFLQGLTYDENDDQILNVLDFYQLSQDLRHSGMSRAQMKLNYLLPLFNLKLDKNQDGRLHRQELRQFVEEMFKQIDTDKDGIFTMEDVTRLMRKYGFDCFQAGLLKTYLTITFNRAKDLFDKAMVYLFKQLDLDGDQQVTIEEFERMHAPCYGFGPPLARRPGEPEDNRWDCFEFLAGFYGAYYRAYGGVRFPDLDQIYQKSYGRRGGSKGEEEHYADYLTNGACDIIM